MSAKATLIPATPAVTEVIVKEPGQPAKVVLELSLDEAETLAILHRHIAGSPRGRRGHMDAIGDALNKAGVDWRKHAITTKPFGYPQTSHHFAGMASITFIG